MSPQGITKVEMRIGDVDSMSAPIHANFVAKSARKRIHRTDMMMDRRVSRGRQPGARDLYVPK